MEIKINEVYRLTENIEMNPQPREGMTVYCGYKGKTVRVTSFNGGMVAVENIGRNDLEYFVNIDQLEELPQKNETMIECTFQEAMENTKKNGGCFSVKRFTEVYKYTYDKNLRRFFNQYGDKMEIDGTEFEQQWIYEPPKQSAFYSWVASEIQFYSDPREQRSIRRARKEGFNALADYIEKNVCFPVTEQIQLEIRRKIKGLKEP